MEELVRWGRSGQGGSSPAAHIGGGGGRQSRVKGGGGAVVDRKLHAMAVMAEERSHIRGGEGDAAAGMPVPT